MILPDNHILFTSADEVQTICRPLHSLNPTLEFAYYKLYLNKKHAKLSTNLEYQKHLYGENYVYEGPLFYCDDILSLDTGIYGTFELASEKYCSILQDLLKVNKDEWLIIIKTSHYHEVFNFWVKDEFNFTNFFLQNLSLFKRFCLYFKDRAKKLIRHVEKQPIALNYKGQSITNTPSPLHQLCQAKWKINRKAFLQATSFSRMKPEDPTIANLTLSAREFECAIALLRNETAQNTAEKLCLSRRTIETYIENLKNKLGCMNKIELKQKLSENTVLKFYQDCV